MILELRKTGKSGMTMTGARMNGRSSGITGISTSMLPQKTAEHRMLRSRHQEMKIM